MPGRLGKEPILHGAGQPVMTVTERVEQEPAALEIQVLILEENLREQGWRLPDGDQRRNGVGDEKRRPAHQYIIIDVLEARLHRAGRVLHEDGRRMRLDIERAESPMEALVQGDRKSTRLNSSHITISYAVFCLK